MGSSQKIDYAASVSLIVYRFVCARCGTGFDAPEAGGAYGEFVMRGQVDSTPALLDAMADPVYEEVDHILRGLGAYRAKSERESAALLQAVFGSACDLARDGTILSVGRNAPCPSCGSRDMASWGPARPVREYVGPRNPITHDSWSRLGRGEREKLIALAADAFAKTPFGGRVRTP